MYAIRSYYEPPVKQRLLLMVWVGSFITTPYSRVLSAKNLIMPEAAMFSKG